MFGLKVSQSGIDVSQAADYQMAFSSEWPTLKVLKKAAFTINDTSVSQTIVNHGLGYPPAFMIITDSGVGARIAGPGNDELGDSFAVDSNNLTFAAQSSGLYTGYYYIFDYDLTRNYTAPTLTIGSSALSAASKTAFGVLASVNGQDASLNNVTGLSMDSQARSPLVHMSVSGNLTSNGTDYSLVANHGLLYPPWFLAFIGNQSSGSYTAFYGGNANQILKTTPGVVEIHSTLSTEQGSVIVFKDPFVL